MFFAVRNSINVLKWVPGQKILGAAGKHGRFILYDPEKQLRLRQFEPQGDPDSFDIFSICWSLSSTKMLIAMGGASGCVEIWDANTGKHLYSYAEHSPEVKCLPPDAYPHRRSVHSLVWSPDQMYIASAGDDYHVRIWQAASGETCRVITEEAIREGRLIAWLPDNKTLVSTIRSEVIIWDAFSDQIIQRIRTPVRHTYPGSRAIAPDGTMIAIVGENIVIYNLMTGDVVHTYEMPENERAKPLYFSRVPGVVAWSPDGTRLAIAFYHRGKYIYIWDIRTGKIVLTLLSNASVECMDWSPDSQTLAWGGDGYLETRDIPPSSF